MSRYKVRVLCPQISEALQKHLFTKGYKWALGETNTIQTDKPFLFVRDKQITFSDSLKYFREDNSEEKSIDFFFADKTLYLGPYKVDIGDDLNVGCEYFSWTEVQAVVDAARELGLIK